MQFTLVHNNLNVFDLDKSLTFYTDALGMKEMRRHEAPDGTFTIVFMEDGVSAHKLELTWMRDWEKPYDLGDNEIHIAFTVDDYEAAHDMHKEMGCICYENEGMGIYFIEDPDGYWMEIVPARR
jgi:lactoylglutathione lyase